MSSKARRCSLLIATSLLLLCGPGSVAHAQLNPIEIEGKLLAATAKTITIQQEGTNEIVVGLIDPLRVDEGVQYNGVPAPELTVKGTEDASFLAPGMFVRLRATLQGGKRVTEAVNEVTLITPDENTVFGITPLDAAVAGADDTDEPDDPRAESEAFVVGQLRAARRTSMVVAFPNNQTLKVPLTREAVVEIDAADGRYVQPGDKVEAKGLALRGRKFFATEITITRAEEENAAGARARAAVAAAKARAAAADPNAPMPVGNPDDPFALGDPSDNEDNKQPDQPPPARKILKIN